MAMGDERGGGLKRWFRHALAGLVDNLRDMGRLPGGVAELSRRNCTSDIEEEAAS